MFTRACELKERSHRGELGTDEKITLNIQPAVRHYTDRATLATMCMSMRKYYRNEPYRKEKWGWRSD
jgi:hypothetical protein